MNMEHLSFMTITTGSDKLIKSCIVCNNAIDTFVNDSVSLYGEDIIIYRNKVSVAFSGELIKGNYISKVR
jgi:hypothetical protein